MGAIFLPLSHSRRWYSAGSGCMLLLRCSVRHSCSFQQRSIEGAFGGGFHAECTYIVAVEHVYIKPFCGPCADICARASARVADGCSWFSWTPHSLSPFLFHFLPMG